MKSSFTAPLPVKLLFRVFNILIILAGLTACASNRAPVQDLAVANGEGLRHHIVAKGETLYAIAWRYGIDYKDLARRNGINSQFTIYPGQKIYLSGTAPRAAVAAAPKVRPAAVAKPAAPPAPPRSKSPTKPSVAARPASTSAARLNWQWPAAGRVLAGFSSSKNLHMGVDIEGRLGESVVAAADGVVVYSGGGIRGYGNLLIVKHNDVYLSAYAHNSKLLVREKDTVRRGQKIAEIGSSGTDRSKLHFEIRREGKPVDPMQYLPKR